MIAWLARPRAAAPGPLVALHPGRPVGRGRVGAKAASLAWLAGRGVPVPPAVAVPIDVVARVGDGDPVATDLLERALRAWLRPGATYAVRPSVTVEAGVRAPLGRRVEARLAVPAAEVAGAVRAVAGEHLAASNSPGPTPGRVAVVVQEMVAARFRGTAFSRNPLTGLDEVVIEAAVEAADASAAGAAGSADVGGPEVWTRRWGAFVGRPSHPRVPPAVVEAVARETARLARAHDGPLELAWAHDGSRVWWLDAQPIGGLTGLHVYSNRIARDMLPGVIKPLVWSANTSIVNAAWIGLLEELVGPLDLRPEDLARSFGYRAYFDMTTFGALFEALGLPRDSLELFLGFPKGPEVPRMRGTRATLRHVPRMVGVARRTLSRGRWTRAELREMRRQHDDLAAVDPAVLDEAALLVRVDAVTALARRAAYANIVIPMILVGYERSLGLQLRAAGVDPALVDPSAGRRDRAGENPNAALDRLHTLVDGLPEAARADLAVGRAAALERHPELAPLRDALDAFVVRFGHLSGSNNDFSRPTWREDRDALVDLVLAHPGRAAAGERIGRDAIEARLPSVQRPLLRLLWRRVGAFRVYREAVGASWGRIYGLLRGTFLALGSRFVARGILDRPDDVFYLALDEVRALAADPRDVAATPGAPSPGDVRALVARRRREVEEAADLVVPDVVYGDAFVPRRRDAQPRVTLDGIPAARGVARGVARVIRDTAEFPRLALGDVLVIPFSDVALTPLFARAAAVVAEETGGILCHAAITAREYGIPCVVAVSGACSEIPDGALVVVDGAAGSVVVEGAPRADPGGE